MEKWELTDESIDTLWDASPSCEDYDEPRAALRLIATAAGEKARRELAREIMAHLEQEAEAWKLSGDSYRVGQKDAYLLTADWLKERGL